MSLDTVKQRIPRRLRYRAAPVAEVSCEPAVTVAAVAPNPAADPPTTANPDSATMGWCPVCGEWQPRTPGDGVLPDHCAVHWHRWGRAIPLRGRA